MMHMHNTKRRTARAACRGVAMLLVMIALVVCMVLVTGFLAGQGTANGIARNEMEYIKAQRAAETGAKLCMAQIKTKSGWRNSMTPGTWLSNVSVGDATVSVTAADSGGNSSFSADPTRGVVLTSIGRYNGRTATLVATIQPTGGGTVFYGGSFASSSIQMDELTRMDSYNSGNGAYSTFSNVSYSAAIGTSATDAGAVSLLDTATLYGTVQLNNAGLSSSVLSVGANVTGPAGVSSAVEVRTPGEVIPPNTTGLPNRVTTSYIGYNMNGPTSGVYTSLSINQAGGLGTNILMNTATVRVTGNMTVITGAKLTVQANQKVVLYVDGNITWNGPLELKSGASLTIFVGGSFTASAAMNFVGGTPANFTVMGLKNAGTVTLKGATQFNGTIFAPQSPVLIQDTAQLYGGAVSKSLRLTDSAKLHWDTATSLRTKTISNVTGGSASPGTALYTVTYQWNPGGA